MRILSKVVSLSSIGFIMAETEHYRIVVVDDDQSTLRLLQHALANSGRNLVSVYQDAERFFHERTGGGGQGLPHVILLGLPADSINPLASFARLRSMMPGVPVIILADPDTHDVAEEALRRDAVDYFSRPIDIRRLRHVIPRVIETAILWKSARKPDAEVLTMDEAKERAVRQALLAARGNVKEAASLLDIGRTTIYKLMER